MRPASHADTYAEALPDEHADVYACATNGYGGTTIIHPNERAHQHPANEYANTTYAHKSTLVVDPRGAHTAHSEFTLTHYTDGCYHAVHKHPGSADANAECEFTAADSESPAVYIWRLECTECGDIISWRDWQ